MSCPSFSSARSHASSSIATSASSSVDFEPFGYTHEEYFSFGPSTARKYLKESETERRLRGSERE